MPVDSVGCTYEQPTGCHNRQEEKMSTNIKKVSCLVCDWSSESQNDIESANQYGECLNTCDGTSTLLRWDYVDGNIRISNTSNGDYVDLVTE
jgi:hypothetical protein